MRVRSGIIFVLILLIAAGLCLIAYFGIPGTSGMLGVANIRQGLDLKGGVTIVYQAKDGIIPTQAQMNSEITLLQGRLSRLGFNDAQVAQQQTNRIRCDIPGVTDVQKTVDSLGQMAQLEFTDSTGKVLLTGADVKTAKEQPATSSANQLSSGGVEIALTFTDEGTKKFADATTANVGKPINIVLDGTVLSSPTVQQAITGGNAVITGSFTPQEATTLAGNIQAGALPFALEILNMNNVGARLGANSLASGINAGIIGFILVFLFMLIVYRLSGLTANVSLFIYLALELCILSFFGQFFNLSLTLPGIAGIILSVGMAVDANIIIFERMKDEFANGKSLRISVDAGFRRAFPAIFDSHVTVIITGFVLLWLGTGTVRGFAQTLLIGTILSLFTALTVTQLQLRNLQSTGLDNPHLFGAHRGPAKNKEAVAK